MQRKVVKLRYYHSINQQPHAIVASDSDKIRSAFKVCAISEMHRESCTVNRASVCLKLTETSTEAFVEVSGTIDLTPVVIGPVLLVVVHISDPRIITI